MDPGFFDSTYWLLASSMLAFREYHSLIEARRYAIRFLMDTAPMPRLGAILHTKYNEYESIIKPLQTWLQDLGVTIRTDTSVRDIDVAIGADTITATRLSFDDADGRHEVPLTSDDLVFFTNGSMTQNTTMGDEATVATRNRSATDRGLFGVWQRLAEQDRRFGDPAAFVSDIDKSNWVSFFTTFTGDRRFFDFMTAKSGEPPGTGGAITIVDSAWRLTVVLYGTYFPDQPDDVQVMWAYGQRSDVPATMSAHRCSNAPGRKCWLNCCTTADGRRPKRTTSLAGPGSARPRCPSSRVSSCRAPSATAPRWCRRAV